MKTCASKELPVKLVILRQCIIVLCVQSAVQCVLSICPVQGERESWSLCPGRLGATCVTVSDHTLPGFSSLPSVPDSQLPLCWHLTLVTSNVPRPLDRLPGAPVPGAGGGLHSQPPASPGVTPTPGRAPVRHLQTPGPLLLWSVMSRMCGDPEIQRDQVRNCQTEERTKNEPTAMHASIYCNHT